MLAAAGGIQDAAEDEPDDVRVAVADAAAARRAPPQVVPERWTLPVAVLDRIRAAATRPVGERLAIATQPFLGLPYRNDAAGEGEGVDPDPPARYDVFDCLTFVEEMYGVVLAGDPVHAPLIRDALRYEGAVRYENRRHFMEAMWVPSAIRQGLFEDITPRLGPARTLTKNVTRDTWLGWGRRRLFKIPDDHLPVGTWTLNYLDLAAAEAAVAKIPAGALILTLRVDRGWIPVVTTHVSMVIAGESEPMMRHATRMGNQKVRDDRLGWYVHHLRDYVNWPALGITVLQPREQGPRISALPR